MILDEYLIKLGFKIDEEAWKKWQDRVTRAGATAANLGLEVTGAALAVGVAIDRIAKQYDNLYFASQRVRSSVQDIRGFEYAGKQAGLTYDEARGSIEAFAAATRMNPGLAGLLKTMGVDPNDSVAASTALIGKLKAQFGEGGYFIAARIAGMYGIEERAFKQLWTNFDRVRERQADFARRAGEAGVDMQGMATKSRAWTQATDSLLTSLGLMTDQMAGKWLPAMTTGVEWLDKITQGFNRAGKDTDGWTSTLLTLIAALGAAKIASVALAAVGLSRVAGVVGLGGWAGTALRFMPGLGSAAMLAAAVYAAKDTPEGKAFKASGELKKDIPGIMRGIKPTLQRWLGVDDEGAAAPAEKTERNQHQIIQYFVDRGWSREQASGITANFYAESKFDPRAQGDGGQAYGVGQWHPDRQAQFKKLFGKDMRQSSLDEQLHFADWELRNTEKPAGDRLRRATTPAAAAAVVSTDYERPKNTAGEATARARLAQQYFDADAQFRKLAGKGIDEVPKPAPKVAGVAPPPPVAAPPVAAPPVAAPSVAAVPAPKVVANDNGPETKVPGHWLQQYFGAGPLAGATASTQVTISQKTDIHVAGGGAAAEVASKVADSQDRVNGDLVRNTKGAVR